MRLLFSQWHPSGELHTSPAQRRPLYRLSCAVEVAELREDVDSLRAELARVRRAIAGLRVDLDRPPPRAGPLLRTRIAWSVLPTAGLVILWRCLLL